MIYHQNAQFSSTTTTSNRELSLVEQKKLQWAKEREEMAKLGELFHQTTKKYEKTCIRTFYSNLDLSMENSVSKPSYPSSMSSSYHSPMDASGGQQQYENRHAHRLYSEDDDHHYNMMLMMNGNPHRLRSPSLPPIRRKEDGSKMMRRQISTEEDTSGYASDSGNQCVSPEMWQNPGENVESAKIRSKYQSTNNLNNINHQQHHQQHHQRRLSLYYPNQTTHPNQMPSIHNNNNNIAGHQPLQQLSHHPSPPHAQHEQQQQNIDLNNKNFHTIRGQGLQGQKNVNNMNNTTSKILSNSNLEISGQHENDYPSIAKPLGSPTSTSSIESHDLSLASSSMMDLSTSGSTFSLNRNHHHNQKIKEERAKWGDRGVTIGHFYDPLSKEIKTSSSSTGGPYWLDKQLSEHNQQSHRESDMDDSLSSRSTSFIRGQNVPIDPTTLAEREIKRRKAMELQNAIKEQLEEREKLKKWEEEKRQREEKIAEERLKKQVEIEKLRIEREQKIMKDKLENEKRKEEAMRLALEKAAMEAKKEKERKKREKRASIGSASSTSTRVDSGTYTEESNEEKIFQETSGSSNIMEKSDAFQGDDELEDDEDEKILIGTPIKLRRKVQKTTSSKIYENHHHSDHSTSYTTPGNIHIHQFHPQHESDIDGIALVLQTMSPISIPIQQHQQQQQPPPPPPPPPPQTHSQNNNNNNSGNNNNGNGSDLVGLSSSLTNLHLAILLAQQQNQLTQQINSLNFLNQKNTNEFHPNHRTDEDVLPPPTKPKLEKPIIPTLSVSKCDASTLTTRFDNSADRPISKRFVDVSTQTEAAEVQPNDNKLSEIQCKYCSNNQNNHQHEIYVKEIVTTTSRIDNSNSDSNSNQTTTTTTTTIQKQQHKSNDKLLKEKSPPKIMQEERPKWGVNRPPIQYLKQSERDPFYIKRLRKLNKKLANENYNTIKSITKRNICTEILPIRTDCNGKIFVNLRESSFILNETSEMRSAARKLEEKSDGKLIDQIT